MERLLVKIVFCFKSILFLSVLPQSVEATTMLWFILLEKVVLY